VALDSIRYQEQGILSLEVSAIRCGLTAYRFLRRLRLENRVRTVYTDGGPWYQWAAGQARLRHVVVSLEECNPWQRAIETIKDRLKAFDVHFPCRCHGKRHIKSLLSLYKAYYNHVRHHITLGGPPTPMKGETEWLRFQNLIKEAMPNALN
jgi:transposase-like protein